MAKRTARRTRPKAVKRLLGKNTRGCGTVIGSVPPATKGTFRRYVTRSGAVVEIKKMSKKAMKKGAWKKCAIRRRRWIKKNGKTIAVWDGRDTKKSRARRASNKGTSANRSSKRGGKRSGKRSARRTKKGGSTTVKKRGKRRSAKRRAVGKKYITKADCRKTVKAAVAKAVHGSTQKDSHVKARQRYLKQVAAGDRARVKRFYKKLEAESKGPWVNPSPQHDAHVLARMEHQRTAAQKKADAARSRAAKKAVKDRPRDSKGRLLKS